jgi:hypothetical protein
MLFMHSRGYCIIFEVFDGYNDFNQDKLQEILANTGFVHIESNTFLHDEKTVDGRIINYLLFLMNARKSKDFHS